MSDCDRTWQRLFEREVAARKALLLDTTSPRDWWKSVEDVLRHYAIQVARGRRPEPPPSELATVLSGLAGYLAVGQIPKPISDVRREGRRIPGPSERRDIGWAVAYREACRPTGLVHEGKKVHVEDRGGPGCLNRFSASISGASAGVRLPGGGAAG